jgi:hypothetical protein
MNFFNQAILVSIVSLGVNAAHANLVLCTKVQPRWSEINDGKLGASHEGPGLIINPKAGRVTWMGTGGYIQLTGQQTPQGVKIIRIDGRPTQERILSTKQNGNVTDYELEDSLGGVGLLRIYLGGSGSSPKTGSAHWQHATDTMKQDLAFCTTHVLND